MIYEIASLPIKTDQIDSFHRAFSRVTHLLSRAKGYKGHRLMQGVETPSHFNISSCDGEPSRTILRDSNPVATMKDS